ncbi:hypothetical protein H6F75_24595 [Nodosilinea sp. FACHB-131]|nr:hypothetical protein [Nodosilinea sp. FACHB-131]
MDNTRFCSQCGTPMEVKPFQTLGYTLRGKEML